MAPLLRASLALALLPALLAHALPTKPEEAPARPPYAGSLTDQARFDIPPALDKSALPDVPVEVEWGYEDDEGVGPVIVETQPKGTVQQQALAVPTDVVLPPSDEQNSSPASDHSQDLHPLKHLRKRAKLDLLGRDPKPPARIVPDKRDSGTALQDIIELAPDADLSKRLFSRAAAVDSRKAGSTTPADRGRISLGRRAIPLEQRNLDGIERQETETKDDTIGHDVWVVVNIPTDVDGLSRRDGCEAGLHAPRNPAINTDAVIARDEVKRALAVVNSTSVAQVETKDVSTLSSLVVYKGSSAATITSSSPSTATAAFPSTVPAVTASSPSASKAAAAFTNSHLPYSLLLLAAVGISLVGGTQVLIPL